MGQPKEKKKKTNGLEGGLKTWAGQANLKKRKKTSGY